MFTPGLRTKGTLIPDGDLMTPVTQVPCYKITGDRDHIVVGVPRYNSLPRFPFSVPLRFPEGPWNTKGHSVDGVKVFLRRFRVFGAFLA